MKTKNPRFIIIIPFYNAREYIKECIDSVFLQTYTNWIVVCTDDNSDDGSSDLIPDDPRIIKRNGGQRRRQLANIYEAIVHSGVEYDEDDVICTLDGDDRLLEPFSLEIVAEIYRGKPNCLLTYGQYVTSSGKPGHCKPYIRNEFDLLREKSFRASHFRTFKWKLYREFLRQDPEVLSYKDDKGDFFLMAADLAIMFPLMEIAGYPNIIFNETPIYWYRLHERNEHVVDRPLQQRTDKEIHRKPRFRAAFLPFHYRIYPNGLYLIRRIFRHIKWALLKPMDKNHQ